MMNHSQTALRPALRVTSPRGASRPGFRGIAHALTAPGPLGVTLGRGQTVTCHPAHSFSPPPRISPPGHHHTRSGRLLMIEPAGEDQTSDSLALETDSGDLFEGIVLNEELVLFAAGNPARFQRASYKAPAGAAIHRLAGLMPGEWYAVELSHGSDGACRVALSRGGNLCADADGVLSFLATSYGPLHLGGRETGTFLTAFFGR